MKSSGSATLAVDFLFTIFSVIEKNPAIEAISTRRGEIAPYFCVF
jgi:hypothetical protein